MRVYRSLVVSMVLACCVAASAAAQVDAGAQRAEPDALLAERSSLEAKIELVRRTMPPEFDLESESRHAREMAKKAEIAIAVEPYRGTERVPLDGGTAPFVIQRVRYSGTASVDAVHFWLTLMAIRSWRMQDLDVLQVEQEASGAPEFVAEFIYPVWPPETPPSDPRRGDPVAQLRASVARSRAIAGALAGYEARMTNGRLARAIALLDAHDDSDTLRMTRLAFADMLELRGVVVSAAGRASLFDSVRDAGFGVERIAMPPKGLCRPFSMVARPGADAKPRQIHDPALSELVALCGSANGPDPLRLAARGTGDLAIRLRGVQIADAMYVLHDLTGAGFVIDDDIDARVDLEFESVTLDEAIEAFRDAGLFIGPGPLRRVSMVARATPSQTYRGDPVSLTFRDAALGQVLCLFQEITSLEVRLPKETTSRVAIYASELPWDLTLEGVIASAGLSYALDEGRLFVGPEQQLASAASRPQTSACDADPGEDRKMRPLLNVAQLDASDVILAGVAANRDGRRAYARALWPPLMRIDPGAMLRDATVVAIEPDAITLKLRDGKTQRIAGGP